MAARFIAQPVNQPVNQPVAHFTFFAVLSTSALLASLMCAASPARAQYSNQQYLNDMRAYHASQLASDLAKLRPSPSNTPYQRSGVVFTPAQKRRNSNWDDNYRDEDRRPATPAERARAAAYLRELEERDNRRHADAAKQARIAEEARLWKIEWARIMAEVEERKRTKAARDAELERRAEAGDYAAIVQSAQEANYGSGGSEASNRVIRAAKLGNLPSIDRIARTHPLLEAQTLIPAAEFQKWRQIAVEKGAPEYASHTAFEQKLKGDTAGAVDTLKAAYANHPDLSNALQIVDYASLLSRPDEAAAYLKEAIALHADTSAVMDAAYGMPVNRFTAPLTLSVLEQAAADPDPKQMIGSALANLRLGDIYSGQDPSWRGFTQISPTYRDRYLSAAAKYPEDFAVRAGEQFARLGDFDQAEKMFQIAGETKQRVNLFLAAEFWRTRTDNKADGEKALRLYALSEGNSTFGTGAYRPSFVEQGDIYFFGQAGITPNKERGLEFYRKGQSEKDANAFRRLAALTWVGDGVPKDEDAALQMLDAVRKFDTDSKDSNGAAFDALQMRMERTARNVGDKTALRTYESELRNHIAAPYNPDPRAMELLGRALVAGDVGASDAAAKAEGWALIERAALGAKGLPSAKTLLGLRAIAPGAKPTPADGALAFERFFTSAREGDAGGGYGLGLCYQNGYGTDKNAAQAKTWFEWAVERGYAPAKEALTALSAPPATPPAPVKQPAKPQKQAPAKQPALTPAKTPPAQTKPGTKKPK